LCARAASHRKMSEEEQYEDDFEEEVDGGEEAGV
jgi:hypothetical protein